MRVAHESDVALSGRLRSRSKFRRERGRGTFLGYRHSLEIYHCRDLELSLKVGRNAVARAAPQAGFGVAHGAPISAAT